MQPAPQTASLTEADIRAALRDCYDPEIACNIVDLGLVDSIALAPDLDAPGAGIPGVPPRHRVHITLTLTTPVDPEDTPLIAQIQNRLAAFETVSRTDVTLLREPAWTPARITPEGRRRLGLDLTSNDLTAKDLISTLLTSTEPKSKDLTSKGLPSKQPTHDLVQIELRQAPARRGKT